MSRPLKAMKPFLDRVQYMWSDTSCDEDFGHVSALLTGHAQAYRDCGNPKMAELAWFLSCIAGHISEGDLPPPTQGQLDFLRQFSPTLPPLNPDRCWPGL